MRKFAFVFPVVDISTLFKCKESRLVTAEETLSTSFSSDLRPDPLNLNKDIQFVRSDLYFILNQGEFLKDETLLRYFREKLDSLYRQNGQVFDDKSLSDKDILRTVKSRYVQHSSEIEAWFDSMVDDLKSLHSAAAFKEGFEKMQREKAASPSPSVQPDTTV